MFRATFPTWTQFSRTRSCSTIPRVPGDRIHAPEVRAYELAVADDADGCLAVDADAVVAAIESEPAVGDVEGGALAVDDARTLLTRGPLLLDEPLELDPLQDQRVALGRQHGLERLRRPALSRITGRKPSPARMARVRVWTLTGSRDKRPVAADFDRVAVAGAAAPPRPGCRTSAPRRPCRPGARRPSVPASGASALSCPCP